MNRSDAAIRGALAVLALAILRGCSDARWRTQTPPVAALAATPPLLARTSLVLTPVGAPPELTQADRNRLWHFASRYRAEGTGRIRIRVDEASAPSLRGALSASLARAGVDAERLAFVSAQGQANRRGAELSFDALVDREPGCGAGGLPTGPDPDDFAATAEEMHDLSCLRRRAILRQMDDAADLLQARRETPRDPRRRLQALVERPAEAAPQPPAQATGAGVVPVDAP